MSRFGVEFRFVEENFKPGNKLIHALGTFPEYSIVTVDDDVIYRRDRLERLLRCRPNDSTNVYAYRARAVRVDTEGRLRAEMETTLAPGRYRAAFPEGVGMVLYPPGSLAPEALDGQTYRAVSLETDDLWYGAHAFRRGTPIVVCPGLEPADHIAPRSQHTALWFDNFANKVNDRNLEALRHAYPELAAWPSGGSAVA